MRQTVNLLPFHTALGDTTRAINDANARDGDTVIIELPRGGEGFTLMDADTKRSAKRYRDQNFHVRDVRETVDGAGVPIYEIVGTVVVAGVAAAFLPVSVVIGALLAWLGGRLLFATVKEVRLITEAVPAAGASVRAVAETPGATVAGIGGGVLMLAVGGLILWKGIT